MAQLEDGRTYQFPVCDENSDLTVTCRYPSVSCVSHVVIGVTHWSLRAAATKLRSTRIPLQQFSVAPCDEALAVQLVCDGRKGDNRRSQSTHVLFRAGFGVSQSASLCLRTLSIQKITNPACTGMPHCPEFPEATRTLQISCM